MTDAAEERRFLSEYDPSAFERPSVAVDVVLLAIVEGRLATLLVERIEHPDKGAWALPGGFVRITESLDAAAARVLREKAGVSEIFLEQLYTFGDPKRDPRTRVVSVAYYALVDERRLAARTMRDSSMIARVGVPWEGEAGGPVTLQPADEAQREGTAPLRIAFDHAEIVGTAVKRIRGKLDYAPIGFELLPAAFTLLELQRVHETVLGRSLNKDSFRRRMLASGRLAPSGASQEDVGHRPAALYRYLRNLPSSQGGTHG
jgi:8-oxo-dGTP diphosphatase